MCLSIDREMHGVLTPSQVGEMKKLLERQQEASFSVSDECAHQTHDTYVH